MAHNNNPQASSNISPVKTVSLAALALMLALVLLPLLDGGFDHHVTYWVFFLLVLAAIYLALQERLVLDLRVGHPLSWYILFLAWAGVSMSWSLNPHRTLVEFLQVTGYGLVFLLASQQDRDSIFRIGRIAVIAGTGAALFGISQYLFLSSSRIQATFTNANPLGIYLVMLFFLGWGLYLRQPSPGRAAVSLVLLVALALTGSRGAYISFLAALPLLFWGIKGREGLKAVAKTAACILLALLVTQGIMLSAPYLQETLGRQHQLAAFLTRPESFIATSGVGRLAFWQVGGRLALGEPLKGHGLGTFNLAYYLEYLGGRWYSRFAHNHYLQTAAELGAVGLGLLLGFLATFVKKSYLSIRQGDYPAYYLGLLPAAAAFLIHIGGDFSWNFPGAAVVFFALAGAAVGVAGNKDSRVPSLKRTPVLVVLLGLLVLNAWQFSAVMMYRQGVGLDSRGDIAGAALVYDRANAIYPINSMAYSFASRNYLQLFQEGEDPGLLEKALVRAQRGVSLSPVDGNLHNNLGRIYWQAGNLPEAEKHLALAVDYAAYRLNMFLDLGWFYLQQGRLPEAEQVFLQGLELEEAAAASAREEEDRERVRAQTLSLHLLLARLYRDMGRPDRVGYHMEAARSLDGEHPAVKEYFGY